MTTAGHRKLLLLGPPCSGKSTVAAHLRACLDDCQYLNLDNDIGELCAERALSGPLSDAVIDEAVSRMFSRIAGRSLVVELPHHDYVALCASGSVQLTAFDCVIVLSARFSRLLARDREREYHVPVPYIARCVGSTEALCCLLAQDNAAWLRFDTDTSKPEHIAGCVADFLRSNDSAKLRKLLIAPVPDRPYLGGSLRAGVEWDNTLIQSLMKRTSIATALDIGCGNGDAVRRFAALGIDAWGLDGYPNRSAFCNRIFEVDFTRQWVEWPMKVDLSWCIEVLEHIPQQHEANVLRTIAANTSKLAFVTAAPPGQPGYHHVNCQPQSYWIERLCNAGLRYVPETPRLLAQLSEEGPFGMNVFKTNGMLFEVPQ